MGKQRRVRTAAGVKRFGAPIGTPIVADPVTGRLRAVKESVARLDRGKKETPKPKTPKPKAKTPIKPIKPSKAKTPTKPKPKTPTKPIKAARTKVERGAKASAPRRNRGDKANAEAMRKRTAAVKTTKAAKARKEKINEFRLTQMVRAADANAPEPPDESVNPSSEAAKKAAKKYVDANDKYEPAITKAVGITSLRHGATMNGLEFRKKEAASFARKVEKDSIDDDISLDEAAANIKDGIRYTAMIDTKNYWEAGDAILEDLVSQGHKVTKDKGGGHKWAKSQYRGRNVQLEDANGVPYELQFHTPQSFDAKMVNHGLFEEKRKLNAKIEEQLAQIKELDEQMAARFQAVPVPPGTILFD